MIKLKGQQNVITAAVIFGHVAKRVKKMKRVLILDGTNNFYRAFVVDPSMSSNGKPIGGVKGFFENPTKACPRN